MKRLKILSKHPATRFFTSSFLAIPVSILTGFFTFRYIEPQQIGLWNKLLLAEVYSTFLSLGIVNGMGRELPLLLGMNKNEEAQNLVKTTYFVTLVTQLLIILLGLIYLLWSSKDFYNNIAIIFLVIRLCMSVYSSVLTSTFRSDSQFNNLSNIMFITLASRILLAPLSMLGFVGFLCYDFGINFITVILLHKARPFKIKPKFDSKIFLFLFKIGFPLFIAAYLVGFFDSFYRQYLMYFSTNYQMGLYATVLVLLNTLALLPSTINTYIYPKLSFNFGKTGNIASAWNILLKIYFVVFIGTGLFCLIGYISLDFFIKFFPKYKEALPFLKLALLIGPLLIYKLGNTINVLLRRNDLVILFVILGGIVQFLALLGAHYTIKSDLDRVILAQLVSATILILLSMVINKIAIKQYNAKNS